MLRRLGYSIIQCILLIRNYGAWKGFSIWRQINLSFSQTAVIQSRLFKNRLHLRKKDSDIDIFNQVFAELQYKWKDIEQLNPAVIVDAGANIGLAAVYFANLFPESKIYCIEPVTANFNLLKQNTSGYGNIQHLQAAVWFKNELLQIENPEGFSAGLTLNSSNKTTGIQGYSIDAIMDLLKIEHIDILKMDVEGAEKEIFGQGPVEWLKKVTILVIELHDMYKDGTANAFFAALNNNFSKMYFQGENIICFLKKN
ncbi:FkbM family methyltransferase [Lacibacter luteus]|uniref:FkbM family methyltransferase n=1 Tax=Lacibacter luteus TaxID=2508719 RepID=A0A4Q1CNN8_9BACT|nr:FkbM family methyltransferase [Lacibacter luteus]RXK62229.1 FkbM family methyltransferase [Lacibacter luteus]